ncbi:MAG TPA: exodeoxyribonuclease VII small subunit [Chitinophagaceae bacterium]|nr:exodeoxyribonuclease VII small subunit [Chitinophagaceae bacterium]
MKSDLNYNEAYIKLQDLVEQLEDGNIPLDKLAAKVKQANELLAVCENKLRQLEADIEVASRSVVKTEKKKK